MLAAQACPGADCRCRHVAALTTKLGDSHCRRNAGYCDTASLNNSQMRAEEG